MVDFSNPPAGGTTIMASVTLPVGANTSAIVATYTPAASEAPPPPANPIYASTSVMLGQQVTQATPTVVITPSGTQPAVALGGSTTASASVSGVAGVVPTGSVTFRVDGTAVSVMLSNGNSVMQVPLNAQGQTGQVTVPLPSTAVTHNVSAVYNGGSTYTTATDSADLMQPVNQGTTSVQLTQTTLSAANGTETLSAQVTASPGATVTGHVKFTLAGTTVQDTASTSVAVGLDPTTSQTITVQFISTDPNYQSSGIVTYTTRFNDLDGDNDTLTSLRGPDEDSQDDSFTLTKQ
jgi:hypothetical protein